MFEPATRNDQPDKRHVDTARIDNLAFIFTIEDHSIKGGFGTQVLEAANRLGLDSRLITVCGMPDGWVYQGGRGEQLAEVELDPVSIARRIRDVLNGGMDAGSMKTATIETTGSKPHIEAS